MKKIDNKIQTITQQGVNGMQMLIRHYNSCGYANDAMMINNDRMQFENINYRPGARPTKTYDDITWWCHNSSFLTPRKMHTFWCMGSKLFVKFQRAPFEVSHKILILYTGKYAFYELLSLRAVSDFRWSGYWNGEVHNGTHTGYWYQSIFLTADGQVLH